MADKISKNRLFVSSAAAAIIAASPAWAQTASAASDRASAAPALSEVIVTAERRSENVQSIPLSVNALSAEQLQAKGGTSSEDLSTLVPAVVYNPGTGGGQMTIRGIGGTNSGVDPGNAVYIDGVYQFAPQSNLFEFNAVERVEILKGPQGTLFGRNSTGGLVQVITRAPSTQKASAEMTVGYANYDRISGNLYLNAPISDTLAVNLAAFGYNQRDGWGRNLFSGAQTHKGYAYGVRAKAKWTAADGKTDVTLSALYNEDKPLASDVAALPPGTRDFFGNPGTGIYDANSDIKSYRADKQYTYSATVHHDFDFARFTSITAYDAVRGYAIVDADLTPAPFLSAVLAGNLYTVSQEFHLQSKEGERLEWIVGALYLRDYSPSHFGLNFGGFAPPPTISKNTTRSYAVFGQATYALTDDTKATVGLRYTDDKARLVAGGGIDKTSQADKPTWRLALDHKFSPDILGYASYSRGFKSGLFNPTDPAKPSARPETLDAFEGGFKTEWLEHRLRVNAAVFYYNFKDIQVQLFDPATSFAYIANAGTARSVGLDVDAAAEVTKALNLTAGLSVIDTEITSGADAPCFTTPPPPMGGLIRGSCPLKGLRLPFAPKVTTSLGATYRLGTEVGDFLFSGVYNHNSGYFDDPSNFAPARTKAYDMVNAAVTWTSNSGRLNASVWGKNLLDERVIGSTDVGAGVGNISLAYPLTPLTFGGTIGAKF